MKKFHAMTLMMVSAFTLNACSVSPIGTSFDKAPPRLVDLSVPKQGEKPVESRAIVNGKVQRIGWDRPNAFGPVPEKLRPEGTSICQAINYNKAIGYHPGALDYAGKPITGGGFFCGN